jgi:hypothetical protein
MPLLGSPLGPRKPVWLRCNGDGPGVVLDVMFLGFRVPKYRIGWPEGHAWHYAHELTTTPMDGREVATDSDTEAEGAE